MTMADNSSVPLFRAFCCQAQVSKTGQELAIPVVPDSTEMEKEGGKAESQTEINEHLVDHINSKH